MKLHIKFFVRLASLQLFMLCHNIMAESQEIVQQETIATIADTTKKDIPQESKTQEPPKKTTSKSVEKIIPTKKTIFYNARINKIILVITTDKNKDYTIPIQPGMQYECCCKIQGLKKAVCHEIDTPKTTLSQSDLTTYAAFVFNSDQKLEKYNFITIHEKLAALDRARKSHNTKLFEEISDQTILKP